VATKYPRKARKWLCKRWNR